MSEVNSKRGKRLIAGHLLDLQDERNKVSDFLLTKEEFSNTQEHVKKRGGLTVLVIGAKIGSVVDVLRHLSVPTTLERQGSDGGARRHG